MIYLVTRTPGGTLEGLGHTKLRSEFSLEKTSGEAETILSIWNQARVMLLQGELTYRCISTVLWIYVSFLKVIVCICLIYLYTHPSIHYLAKSMLHSYMYCIHLNIYICMYMYHVYIHICNTYSYEKSAYCATWIISFNFGVKLWLSYFKFQSL